MRHTILRRRFLASLLVLVATTATVWAQSPTPLRVGLFPNLSPRTLISMYQPMREALEQGMGQPVELQTAPSLEIFSKRLSEGDYDVALAAPHMARLAQRDSGYQLIARYHAPIEACLIAHRDARPQRLAELRGSHIATPDDVALVAMLGHELLAGAGLEEGHDYTMYEAKSHSNAALAVANHQADAAFVGCVTFHQLPDNVRAQLRILDKSSPVPSQYFVVSPQISASQRERFTRSLLAFPASRTGRAFIEQHRIGGISPTRPDELKGMDPYADKLRQILLGVKP